MADERKNIFKRTAHIAFLIVIRPFYSIRRLREKMREIGRKEIKTEISLDSLPEVKLLTVNGNTELEDWLLEIYADNPSTLVAGPMNHEALREKQSENYDFYLVMDLDGNKAGAIAFNNDHSMIRHLVTNFRERSKGLGLSAVVELEKIKMGEGICVLWGQVYKKNFRALSLYLSLGFRIVEEESPSEYYTIRKIIPSGSAIRSA